MSNETRHRPIHCGTQYVDWQNSNCCRCKLYPDDDYELSDCEIFNALSFACVDDGTVSEEIARRMNLPGNELAYIWQCGEVQWTEEWKTEWRKKHAE